MSERLTPQYREDGGEDYSLLFEQLIESGDTAGLYRLWQALVTAPVETEYPTNNGPKISYARTLNTLATSADKVQEAWHEAHIAQAEQNRHPFSVGSPPDERAFSQIFHTILTTLDYATFDASMHLLDRWGELFYCTQPDSEVNGHIMTPALLATRDQIIHVLVNETFYHKRLLERIAPRSEPSTR